MTIIQRENIHWLYWTNKQGKLENIDDLPAVIWKKNNDKEWFKNGKRHRLFAPAVTSLDGTEEWYVNGKNITDQILVWANENDIDLTNMTPEDKLYFKLIWECFGT